ncbi:hypothetical protein BKA64DRAFT_60580 [Cadophora sp. MPI-SDFR-AT-0126]|nr:hypothetical protein BKA64DRAFT_60580 [Leotiomycetes sp. MPI-SDFR-AT-0126]
MDPDPFTELERLASNATSLNPLLPTAPEISRWTTLFNYTPAEANTLLIAHRSDISRTPISDAHWSLVRADRENAGYDREAYEHSLLLVDVLRSHSSVVVDAQGKRWTLFRLGGVLGGEERVRGICGGERELKVTTGVGVGMGMGLGEGEQEVEFVWVDEEGKRKVEEWVRGWGVLGKGKVGDGGAEPWAKQD